MVSVLTSIPPSHVPPPPPPVFPTSFPPPFSHSFVQSLIMCRVITSQQYVALGGGRQSRKEDWNQQFFSGPDTMLSCFSFFYMNYLILTTALGDYYCHFRDEKTEIQIGELAMSRLRLRHTVGSWMLPFVSWLVCVILKSQVTAPI